MHIRACVRGTRTCKLVKVAAMSSALSPTKKRVERAIEYRANALDASCDAQEYPRTLFHESG